MNIIKYVFSSDYRLEYLKAKCPEPTIALYETLKGMDWGAGVRTGLGKYTYFHPHAPLSVILDAFDGHFNIELSGEEVYSLSKFEEKLLSKLFVGKVEETQERLILERQNQALESDKLTRGIYKSILKGG